MTKLAISDGTRARDAELVAVARDIKVLSTLSWPVEMGSHFLEGWRRGDPTLPAPPAVAAAFGDRRATLERLARPASSDPLDRFLARTADSYLTLMRLLESVGTPAFCEHSRALYGAPRDPVAMGSMTNLEAAATVVEATTALALACEPAAPTLSAETVAERMRERMAPFFVDHPLRVRVEASLAAKATAGAEGVRLRASARFTEMDVVQLIEHEAFVHSATAINGRQQALASLSLGAPRTTATQEGLATFAEFITCAMDIARLRRIALRVIAVDHALEGADFIEVFRFFLDAGQTEEESVRSAQRVFRGGDVRGHVAFTKDAVYLRGLLAVHAFLHAALGARKVHLAHALFSGRMTCRDAIELEPYFEAGVLVPPRYEPGWLKSRDNLAAYLAFSAFTHGLPIEQLLLSEVIDP